MSLQSLLDLANIAVAGFSVVVALILFLAYALLVQIPSKSAHAVLSCAVLLTALTVIQFAQAS